MMNELQEKRWKNLSWIESDIVKIWCNELLEKKNKMSLEELTIEEIKEEIEEAKRDIKQYRMWNDRHSIMDCKEYIEVLEEVLEELEEV